MSHVHNIIDTDSHFYIDPVKRTVTTKADKLYVVQYDHDSERFTFQVNRFVEEHDMTQCDRIEVHFTNTTRRKDQRVDDVYHVKIGDRSHDNDTFFFSWLVSSNATQLVGTLQFSISFICLDENGEVSYEWSTTTNDTIQVLTKLENTELVKEKYPDLYNQLKQDILNSIPSSGGSVDPADIEQIVIDYLENNPPAKGEPGAPGQDGYSPTINVEESESGYELTITDSNSTKTIHLYHGTPGKDGFSPIIEVTDIENGHLLTITDINGTKTIEVLNGKNGTASADELIQLVDERIEENSKNAVVEF